jgi:hypothetical protein
MPRDDVERAQMRELDFHDGQEYVIDLVETIAHCDSR